MLFNTPEFFVFFVIVLVLYFSLTRRWQNVLMVVASYVFYGWWDWRFLFLLFFSSLIDFWVGQQLSKHHSCCLAH